MTTGRLLRFTSTNVFTNLAAEERLFQKSVDRSLLFYINSECVVIGRTQNPFKEVDVAYAARNGIPIARRRSGGGAVVHDEGNLNFCFIRPRSEHEPLGNAKLIAGVLKDEFGINAAVNSRADILVDGKKVSGAAYRISRDRAYHHGTLLINSNLDRLRRVLKSPMAETLEASGTASVPSPVTNLSDHCALDIDAVSIVEAIADRYSRKHAGVMQLTPASVERTFGGMQSERAELGSHSWVYGKMPKFSFRHSFGDFCVKFDVGKGAIISKVSVEGESGSNAEARQNDLSLFLHDCLNGKPFDGKILADEVRQGAQSTSNHDRRMKEPVTNLLASEIQAVIPRQFWRDETEVPTQAYN